MKKYLSGLLGLFFLILGFFFWMASGPDYKDLMLLSIGSEILAVFFFIISPLRSKKPYRMLIGIGITLSLIQIVFSTGLLISLFLISFQASLKKAKYAVSVVFADHFPVVFLYRFSGILGEGGGVGVQGL